MDSSYTSIPSEQPKDEFIDPRSSIGISRSDIDSNKNINLSEEDGEESGVETFPKSVLFIIGNEFCERFSFYGMKVILPLYLTGTLGFTQDRSTTLIHSFNFSAYFFTLFGGILSDALLGRFRTILLLSVVYCAGMAVLAGSSFPGVENPHFLFLFGLVLVALGTGGIKPCVSAFGGDQFNPNHLKAISTYFSIFYFSINAGSVLSMFITPIFRKNFHCFGQENCYPLAFGVPAVLMCVATVVFAFGSSLYVCKPASRDASSLKVLQVIGSASFARLKATFSGGESTATSGTSSWLDYADTSKYSREFIRETRIVLGIFTVFIPISLFWALYDQQGSRWTYQAIMMNGKTGPIQIKPEQMGVFNAILILLLIPAFDRVIYPFLTGRLNVSLQPLAKIFWGMFLAALSFVLAGLLQFVIERRGVFTENPSELGTLICRDGCVHVLWQVPQYVVLTCAEVMLSITGLEFAYSQAPESMKSVCSSAWLLTVAAGNLVVIFFNELNPVAWFIHQPKHQMTANFIFWAAILFAGTFCFALVASNYKYVNIDEMRTISIDNDESIVLPEEEEVKYKESEL